MFHIKIAFFSFKCPLCGIQIMKGEVYMEDNDGLKTCFCQLPKRKLKPIITKKKYDEN